MGHCAPKTQLLRRFYAAFGMEAATRTTLVGTLVRLAGTPPMPPALPTSLSAPCAQPATYEAEFRILF